jgi:hypothetical protein
VNRGAQAEWLRRELAPEPRSGSFRALLGDADWRRLPAAVQRRFGRELTAGESAVYVGEVASTELTRVGWWWAQLARLMGAPLPLKVLTHTSAAVVVTADAVGDTQLWTRIYHETGRLPQVIRSMKHFSGSTGLEERVGAGIGMALVVSVEARALVFWSAGYHWRCGRIQLRIPSWLTPGSIEVRHREERAGRFSFTLTVLHPWFGRIIHQVAFFRDAC